MPLSPKERAEAALAQSPLALYGDLFVDVQMQGVFDDGKTFVDLRPRRPEAAHELESRYRVARGTPGFRLADFVAEHFEAPAQAVTPALRKGLPLADHIVQLWPLLERDSRARSAPDSLLPLGPSYVVPGGRFRELYYWDSYFTMLGLLDQGERPRAQAMLDAFVELIDRYGFIPNSNRSYMLTRSQPPFFFKMVEAMHAEDPAAGWARYLPQLRAEHAWWLHGSELLQPGQAAEHSVRLVGGQLLNRYWDSASLPREESWREDVLTAQKGARAPELVYRDLRAAAESGWDFSSRWCLSSWDLATIDTTAILPIDLNSLLWGLERAIQEGHERLSEAAEAAHFAQLAEARRSAIERLMWQDAAQRFGDYHWRLAQPRAELHAAIVLPLYVGLASGRQALGCARALQHGLLSHNGLLTSTLRSGQQWDAPNGWAPLQWMAVAGLRRYGQHELAETIARRWLATLERVHAETGKLMEKYDVTEDRAGGGGEYPAQDGFGWTNASYLLLKRLYP
jgi:alpha,alpha-trehalase